MLKQCVKLKARICVKLLWLKQGLVSHNTIRATHRASTPAARHVAAKSAASCSAEPPLLRRWKSSEC